MKLNINLGIGNKSIREWAGIALVLLAGSLIFIIKAIIKSIE